MRNRTIRVIEQGGNIRKYKGKFSMVISSNGVLTIRNIRGETVKAYPEGAWVDAELLCLS